MLYVDRPALPLGSLRAAEQPHYTDNGLLDWQSTTQSRRDTTQLRSPARTRPPASPSEPTSAPPRTSSAPRTTVRPGRPRARRANAVDLTGISCSDAEDCVAVGNTGNLGAGSTIMGTTTAGLSWTAQNPPPGTSRLSSVSCPSTADCFAVGVNSVLASVNEGYAWSPQTDSFRRHRPERHFVRRRRPTARRWGSASSGARSSSGPSTRARHWTSEPVPSGVGILTGVSCTERDQLSRRERLRQLRAQHHRDQRRRCDVDGGAVPGDRDRLHGDLLPGCLRTAPPWVCRPAARVR